MNANKPLISPNAACPVDNTSASSTDVPKGHGIGTWDWDDLAQNPLLRFENVSISAGETDK